MEPPKIMNPNQGLGQRMNLADQISRDKAIRPAGYYSSIVFDVLIVVLAFWFGYEGKQLLHGNGGTLFFIALLTFSTASIMQMFLARSFTRRFIIMTLEIIVLLANFWNEASLNYLGFAGAAALLLLAWGELSARHELENSLSIRFARASHLHLKKFASALSILAVMLFIPKLSTAPLFVSQESFQNFFDVTAGLLNRVYPEFAFNSTVGDFTKSLVRYQAGKSSPDFNKLSPAAQDAFIAGQLPQVEASLGQALGEKLNPTEPVSAALRDYIIRMLKGWQDNAPQIFMVVWAVVMFFVIRSIGSIFNFAAIFVAFVAYELLLAFNFIHISAESRAHEFVHYSL